jgi:hypothetical protein
MVLRRVSVPFTTPMQLTVPIAVLLCGLLAPTEGRAVEETANYVTDSSYQRVEKSDCGGYDIKPQPACGGNRNQSVAVLEACCDATRGCGGFNTHGVIKTTACADHVKPQPTTDLYLKPACKTYANESSCPTPRCAWTPAGAGGDGTCGRAIPPPFEPQTMPWPYPNDERLSTGTTTIQLSHDFAISRAAGPPCPTLDTAVQRYQKQAVGLHIARVQDGNGTLMRQLIVTVIFFMSPPKQHGAAPITPPHVPHPPVCHPMELGRSQIDSVAITSCSST